MSMLVERIRQVILESRKDFVQQKYRLSEEEMNALLAADPTPNKEYIEWLAIQQKNGAISIVIDRNNSTRKFLTAYNKLKNTGIILPAHKQINKFSFDELKDVLDLYGLLLPARSEVLDWDSYRKIADVVRGKDIRFLEWASDAFFRFKSYLLEDLPRLKEYLSLVSVDELRGLETLADLSRFLTRNGRLRSERDVNIEKLLPTIEGEYSKMYEDERYSVFIPETFKASCTLGKGTEWCTAASRSLYDKYSREGDLYIIVDKQTGKRTQAHFGEGAQIMDEDDERTYIPYALYGLFKPLGATLDDCIKDPGIPTEALEKLSKHPEKYIRQNVAANANVPLTILEKLADDKDADVRFAVAGNENTPFEILDKLADDFEWYVRKSVAGNANAPLAVLEKLTEDPDDDVRKISANAIKARNAA